MLSKTGYVPALNRALKIPAEYRGWECSIVCRTLVQHKVRPVATLRMQHPRRVCRSYVEPSLTKPEIDYIRAWNGSTWITLGKFDRPK